MTNFICPGQSLVGQKKFKSVYDVRFMMYLEMILYIAHNN